MPRYNDVILGEVVDLFLLHLINLAQKSNAAKVALAFDSDGTITPSSWDFQGSKNDLEFLCQEKSNFKLLAILLNAAQNYPGNIPINLFIVSNQFRSQDAAEKANERQLLGLESIYHRFGNSLILVGREDGTKELGKGLALIQKGIDPETTFLFTADDDFGRIATYEQFFHKLSFISSDNPPLILHWNSRKGPENTDDQMLIRAREDLPFGFCLESIMLYLISEKAEIPQPLILKFNCSNRADLEKKLRVDMGLPPISQAQDNPDPSCLKTSFRQATSEQNHQYHTNG